MEEEEEEGGGIEGGKGGGGGRTEKVKNRKENNGNRWKRIVIIERGGGREREKRNSKWLWLDVWSEAWGSSRAELAMWGGTRIWGEMPRGDKVQGRRSPAPEWGNDVWSWQGGSEGDGGVPCPKGSQYGDGCSARGGFLCRGSLARIFGWSSGLEREVRAEEEEEEKGRRVRQCGKKKRPKNNPKKQPKKKPKRKNIHKTRKNQKKRGGKTNTKERENRTKQEFVQKQH